MGFYGTSTARTGFGPPPEGLAGSVAPETRPSRLAHNIWLLAILHICSTPSRNVAVSAVLLVFRLSDAPQHRHKIAPIRDSIDFSLTAF